uniref:hypothetical protein n=1 Tax=Alistipes sp. TaxID=1872444 RepID=UPI004057590A
MKFNPFTLQGFAAVAGVRVVMFGETPQSAYKITRTHYGGTDAVVVGSSADVHIVLYEVCKDFFAHCKERGTHADFVARFTDDRTGRFLRNFTPEMLSAWNGLHSDQISVERIK